jgi:hypothetical protein
MKQDAPMPGRFANRQDKNLVQRTQNIQRKAQIQNAAGGAYGERKANQEIASGAVMANANTRESRIPIPQGNPLAQNLVVQDAFAQGNPDTPLSHGANGGPGEDASINKPVVDDINSGSTLARAMLMANPTPQLMRIVEAFNEAGI